MRGRLLGTVAAALLAAGPLPGQVGRALPPGDTLALAPLFEGVEEATVVVLGPEGTVSRYHPDRAGRRFPPASTFKIANTVIALESGVVDGPGFTLAWDSTRVPRTGFFPDAWARDQTLRSAFRHSVLWFYQEIARRIGIRRMTEWLRRLEYGNGSVGGAIDRFWLDGTLRTSPDEQVRFLDRLLRGELGVSPPTLGTLRQIALLAEGDGWRLYGKTGTSEVTATRENGWIVGWAERDDRRWCYAIDMEGERVWEQWPPQRRHELALRVLREVGAIPASR